MDKIDYPMMCDGRIFGVPDGYEPVWPNDPRATHAICVGIRCERHELVLKDADSHTCNWLYLSMENKDDKGSEVGNKDG